MVAVLAPLFFACAVGRLAAADFTVTHTKAATVFPLLELSLATNTRAPVKA
jgi:hypothetical protein